MRHYLSFLSFTKALVGLPLIMTLLSTNICFSQVCVNNPSVQQGNLSSASGSGVLSFTFIENLLDYTDEETAPVRITVCMQNMGPQNGVNAVQDGTNYFTWSYDQTSNCLEGVQNKDILGGSGGLISVDYIIGFDPGCSLSTFGFYASITPVACMLGINETIDDTLSVYLQGSGSGLQSTNAICGFHTGTAYIIGSGNFNVLWSTGATTQIITGLNSGFYHVTVSDTNNTCSIVDTVFIGLDSCTRKVSGTVVIDHFFADCQIDQLSYPDSNRTVFALKNGVIVYTTSTDINGQYSFFLDTGGYMIQLDTTQYDLFTCPTGFQQPVFIDSTDVILDFIFNVVPNINGNLSIDHKFPDCQLDYHSYGAQNRTVFAFKNGVLIDSTITDINGDYSFFIDTGTYVIQMDTLFSDLFDCSSFQQTVVLGSVNITVDFIFNIEIHQLVGNLYVDHIAPDCQVDQFTYHGGNRVISAFKNGALVDMTNSNSGLYSFYLEKGTYTIQIDTYSTDLFVCPTGYQQTVVIDSANANVHLDFIFDVLPGTGIVEEEDPIGDFLLYPNPTNGIANLEMDLNRNETLTIQLFNMNGQLLHQPVSDQLFMKGNHQISIHTKELAVGIYLIRFIGTNASKVMKLERY